MPFPFILPTTNFIDLTHFYNCTTHPELIVAATKARTTLRAKLKAHKRLVPIDQFANLPHVVTALNAYIPYLLAIDAGFSGGSVAGDELDVLLLQDARCSWRPTLAQSKKRTRLRSLEADVFLTLNALAMARTLQAREALRPLYRLDTTPSDTDRRRYITTAMTHLQDSRAVYQFLAKRAAADAVDVSDKQLPEANRLTHDALASLALAEATLIAVLKDDPYPVAVANGRNARSKDWMVGAPNLSIARINILVRLCMCAAQHAQFARGLLSNVPNVDANLQSYVTDLARTAKAKAERFSGIAAESQGRVGDGLGWLQAARAELRLTPAGSGDQDGSTASAGFLASLRQNIRENREDQRIAQAKPDWGIDAGRYEEGRVIEMLHKKWQHTNDKMFVQLVPKAHDLVSQLPTGREFHGPVIYCPPELTRDDMTRLRDAPKSAFGANYSFDYEDDEGDAADSQSDNDESTAPDPVGALPGAFHSPEDYESEYCTASRSQSQF